MQAKKESLHLTQLGVTPSKPFGIRSLLAPLNLPMVERTFEAQCGNVFCSTFISCACIEEEAYDLLTRHGMSDAEALATLHIKLWARCRKACRPL